MFSVGASIGCSVDTIDTFQLNGIFKFIGNPPWTLSCTITTPLFWSVSWSAGIHCSFTSSPNCRFVGEVNGAVSLVKLFFVAQYSMLYDSVSMLKSLQEWTFSCFTSWMLLCMAMVRGLRCMVRCFHTLTGPNWQGSILLNKPHCMLDNSVL